MIIYAFVAIIVFKMFSTVKNKNKTKYYNRKEERNVLEVENKEKTAKNSVCA